LRIQASQVAFLEQSIDRLNAELHPLTSFVLPGGTPAAAWAHFARTVCRRAERTVVGLSRVQRVNPQSLIYLNRLSDLLFVLARWFNSKGTQDVLWEPGLGQS
jgi:cob(I)alamin adenosyltransferase